MRVVTRRTGLSPDVLRAWENRYHAVNPHRSDGGQRVYSDEDVDRLVLLRRVTALGRSIGQVAKLRTDQLRTLLMDDESALEAPDDDGAADAVRIEATRLVEAFDADEMEKVLRRGALTLGVGALIDRVIVPMMDEIGDRRHQAGFSPAHDHFAGNVVERTLNWIRETGSQAPDALHIAVATTEGERSAVEIQIVGAVAATLAWRVTNLGLGLPVDSILEAAHKTGVKVVGLSFQTGEAVRRARDQLGDIRNGLASGVAMIAVGAGATEMRSELTALGLSVMTDQGELRAFLKSYA